MKPSQDLLGEAYEKLEIALHRAESQYILFKQLASQQRNVIDDFKTTLIEIEDYFEQQSKADGDEKS